MCRTRRTAIYLRYQPRNPAAGRTTHWPFREGGNPSVPPATFCESERNTPFRWQCQACQQRQALTRGDKCVWEPSEAGVDVMAVWNIFFTLKAKAWRGHMCIYMPGHAEGACKQTGITYCWGRSGAVSCLQVPGKHCMGINSHIFFLSLIQHISLYSHIFVFSFVANRKSPFIQNKNLF